MDTVVYALLKKKITSALTGIASITADENGKLIFVTNDGATFTVNIPGGALPEDFTVTNGVGKAELGTEYKAGTAIADIVIDMLSTYAPPQITISTNLSKEVLDVEEPINSINIVGKVVKGSKDINSVTIYVDGTPIKTYEGDELAEDGVYSVVHKFNPETNKTFIIKITANDGENTTKTKTITFIGKSYWGCVGDIATDPTEEEILGLPFTSVKNSKALVYQDITVKYGKVIYAYPASLGKLARIEDEDNRNYTNSYDMFELKVKDINYYCYRLHDSMGTNGAYQKFS